MNNVFAVFGLMCLVSAPVENLVQPMYSAVQVDENLRKKF